MANQNFIGEDYGCGYCQLYGEALQQKQCVRGESMNFTKCGVAGEVQSVQNNGCGFCLNH